MVFLDSSLQSSITNYFLKFTCLYEIPSPKPPDIVRAFAVLVSSFACVVVVEALFKYSSLFQHHETPVIIPSWAAAVILTCNALESPFGQPYSLFLGTFISCVLGVGLTKLWLLIPENEDTLWVCGALSGSLSSVLMSWAQLIHPAAGSAAILPAVNDEIRNLGWFFLVVQIVTSLIVIAVSSIFSNLYAQYPLYWFLPPHLEKETPVISTIPDTNVEVERPNNISTPSQEISNQIEPLLVIPSSTSDVDDETGPAPVPYSPDQALQPQETNTELRSTFSLSREPTAEDDENAEATSNITSTKSRLILAVLETRDRIRALPPPRALASNALSKAVTNSRYLNPIPTTIESSSRMAALFPNIDLSSAAIITATSFSFPPELQFTAIDKGILISIQKKLGGLVASQNNTLLSKTRTTRTNS